MRIELRIPDGEFADALMIEAAKRNQTEASMCVAFVRTMLNKNRHHVRAYRVRDRSVWVDADGQLRVRATLSEED